MCSDDNDDDSFTGYRWTYFSSLDEGSLHSRAEQFLKSTDWDSLVECASAKRNGMRCRLVPDTIGLGFNHMVRILEFDDDDKTRWVARLRMPGLLLSTLEDGDCEDQKGSDETRSIMGSEYTTIQLVRKETKIPVPKVHIFEDNLDGKGKVNAQFMLMDCLKGNAGIDLDMRIPPEYKADVFARMAEIHISMCKIRLPKIGKIISINDDGTYLQGPIPGLGGPFETATEFFKAWATKIEFGLTESQLKEAAGPFAGEVSLSASSLKSWIHSNAEKISVCNKGPFPLCHGDFGHNNMIFDDKYRLLGVIDWEGAFAAPWEVAAEFPLSLSVVPPPIDVPWNYDEMGTPKDEENRQRFADREEYIAIVEQQEGELGFADGYRLSEALRDDRRQYLASAMRLYQNGKPGWYAKVTQKWDNKGI